MNKQPYYHDIQILFTTTTGMVSEELARDLKAVVLKHRRELDIVEGTIEVMESGPEAGDPHDLM